MKVLTDRELRSHWFKNGNKEFIISEEMMITPAARDFIKEHDIVVTVRSGDVHHDKIVNTDGKKPEDATHLRGGILISKGNPRIAFRGMLDSLGASIIHLQLLAKEEQADGLCASLNEVLLYVRSVLRAEVMDEPLEKIVLFGLSSEQLRYESHHVREIYGIDHPIPDYKMGRLCVGLNCLRTKVRETELAAIRAFKKDEICERLDIIEGLNRLSSGVYILFCRQLTAGLNTENERERFYIPVEVSGRHVHLTKQAAKALFGKDTLTKVRDLSQPGQYVAKERVTLVTLSGEIGHVAVLGPFRDSVQVEMSMTDARVLGLELPVNLSGDHKGAQDIIISGPQGVFNAVGGAMISKAHIHMTPEDARHFGVTDKEVVRVQMETKRPVTIDEVVVRVSEQYVLSMHLDYDEANACQFKKGDRGYIVKKSP